MLILEINGQRPRSVAHARKLISGRSVSRLYVQFEGRGGYLSVRAQSPR